MADVNLVGRDAELTALRSFLGEELRDHAQPAHP
jgi:hypothetical protein